MSLINFVLDNNKLKEKLDIYTKSINHSINTSLNKLKDIQITEFQTNIKEIFPCCAVDGSYTVHWKYTKQIKNTNKYHKSDLYLCSIACSLVVQTYYKNDKNEDAYKTEKNIEEIPLLIDMEKVPDEQKRRYTLQKILETLMSAREKYLSLQYSETHNKNIIMIDGSLHPLYSKNKQYLRRDETDDYDLTQISKYITFINEDMDIIDWFVNIKDLENSCVVHDNILVGVSKDSKLKNENGVSYIDLFDLAMMAQDKYNRSCYYKPKVINDMLLKNDAMIIFAKLDPNATISHRIDFSFTGYDLDTEVLPLLHIYSKYKRIIGTPVTPQVCHADVVKIRQLKDYRKKDIYEYLKNAGFNVSEITMGLTDDNGELLNIGKYHDFLDKII